MLVKEDEFIKLCKDSLEEAIKNNDGWLAHFYGSMLLNSTPIINPRIYKYKQINIE